MEMWKMRGWRRWTGLAVLVAAVALAGCSDDEEQDPTEFAPPSNLTYVNGDGQITLSWDHSSDRNLSNFAGYDVYRHTESMIGMTLKELAPLRVNTTAISTNGFVDSVNNGDRWYYSVRAVKDNGDLSAATNEVDTAARADGGSIVLAEFADPARPSGFDFSTGMAMGMTSSNPDNRPFVDMYLGTTGDNDETDQPLAIKSPALVQNGATAWAARAAGFKVLDDFDTGTTSNSGWQDSITLGADEQEIVGKVIAVKIPIEGSNTFYGKFRIDDAATNIQGQREIEITWAYQPTPNYIRFRTAGR